MVVVLPELSEVLSKICDFSGPLKEKRERYKNFNFTEMERFFKSSTVRNDEMSWQDAFVDEYYCEDILKKESDGHRYLEILKKISP